MRVAAFLCIGLAAVAAACGSSEPELAASSGALPLIVELAEVRAVDLPQSFEAGGVLRGGITASIASRVMAPIVAVHMRPGDPVRRGAVLVTLDARESAANDTQADAAFRAASEAVRTAEADQRATDAQLRLARLTHARIQALHAKRSATEQELDQAVAALTSGEGQAASAEARSASAIAAREAARAARDAARVSVSYFRLMAPFDGVVLERMADPGSMAVPGAPIISLEDSTGPRLEVQVDEARASGITVGQDVEYRLDNDIADRWRAARVIEIGRLDAVTHAFLVKVDVSGTPHVRSGTFGRVRFPGRTYQTIAVPRSAIVRRGQLTVIFRVDRDGRARLRPIRIGIEANDLVEVVAGLSAGDSVVAHPPLHLADGTRVVEP